MPSPVGDAGHAEVEELLATLSDGQRAVVELRLAGLTHREIAAVLGKSDGAVRVAHHRAVERLRALVRQEVEIT